MGTAFDSVAGATVRPALCLHDPWGKEIGDFGDQECAMWRRLVRGISGSQICTVRSIIMAVDSSRSV